MPAAKKVPHKHAAKKRAGIRLTPYAQQAKSRPTSKNLGAAERHAAFAREYFTDSNAMRAYRAVYDPEGIRSQKVVETCAFKIKAHPRVQAELARLQKLHAAEIAKAEAEAKKQREAEEARSIATRTEILQFNTAVMRASSSDLSEANRPFVHVTERKVLAPVKYDKEGEEIPNPDADEDGYVTSVERAPPTIKERIAAAAEITKMQGWTKPDGNGKKVADALTNLLTDIRGGGTAKD